MYRISQLNFVVFFSSCEFLKLKAECGSYIPSFRESDCLMDFDILICPSSVYECPLNCPIIRLIVGMLSKPVVL